jgi:hypothetical protein
VRVVWVVEWAKYLNKHYKWVQSEQNDIRTYTNSIILETFRGFDGVFEFELTEEQVSSTPRTHIFTLM